MDETLLIRLEGLIKTLDQQVTKEDFVSTLELVLRLVLKIEKRNTDAVSSLEKTYEHLLRYAKEDHSKSLADLKGQVDQVFVKSRLTEMETSLNGKIDAKLSTVRNGKDSVVPGPQGHPGRPGRDGEDTTMTPGVRAELDELRKEVDQLRKRPVGVGGGTTNLRIQQAFKYILKTEAPVGLIDGVNTTYSTKQPIFAVLAMSINGETIAQLPNYTVAGKSFTFTSPLPADYSGKDFEIKYI